MIFEMGVILAAVSGVLLALLGLLLLLIRPRRTHAVAFAAFALLWGISLVFANASRLSGLDQNPMDERFWTLLFVATTICVYVPLAYFADVYPTRHGLFATRPAAAALLLAPAAGGAFALVISPELLLQFDPPAGGAPARFAWGPLFPLYSVLFYGSFYYSVLGLHRHQQRAQHSLEVRRSVYVLCALAVYLSFDTVENLSQTGWSAVGGGFAWFPSWQAAVFFTTALAGVVTLTVIAHGLARDRRPDVAAVRPVVLAAFLVPAAFGLLSGLSKVLPGVGSPIDTVGLWRILSAVLIAYAILRYELFDIDAKLKRGFIVSGLFGGVLALAVGVEQGMERVLGSTGVAITTIQFLLVSAVVFVLARMPAASAWLGARVLPAVDASRQLDERRLEVYEAAVAQAASSGSLAGEATFLAELRRRLGITQAEHDLISRLVESPRRRPGAPETGFETGSVVADRYKLENVLGEGAFGRAFLAEDATLGRRVVLKAIHPHRARSAKAVRAFLKEARLAGGLEHPNVVRIYDYGSAGGTPYIVMEYAEGGSLKDLMNRVGPLPPDEATRIMRDVLSGLAAVHEHGILHRDLKPGNILLARDGTARIADFGLALGEDVEATQSGLDAPGFGPGTPAYMSPEAVKDLPLMPAADLYAAGALLYHMLTGETYLSFEGRNAFEIRRAIQEEPPRVPSVPLEPHLEILVARALRKDPRERFASARAMMDALEPRPVKARP